MLHVCACPPGGHAAASGRAGVCTARCGRRGDHACRPREPRHAGGVACRHVRRVACKSHNARRRQHPRSRTVRRAAGLRPQAAGVRVRVSPRARSREKPANRGRSRALHAHCSIRHIQGGDNISETSDAAPQCGQRAEPKRAVRAAGQTHRRAAAPPRRRAAAAAEAPPLSPPACRRAARRRRARIRAPQPRSAPVSTWFRRCAGPSPQ